MDNNSARPSSIFFIVGCLLVLLHYLIFDQFFPNRNNNLGHDYALFMPAILDGEER